jgi:nucleoredoxin
LAEFYDEVISTTSDLEVVFVSSDSDQSSFEEYFKTMPWKALPFGSSQKDALSAKFGVRGIPTLVGEL